MIKLDELQKALDEVEAIVWATCGFGSLGREKRNVLLYQFSMFKDEYVGQVHVSRKQLSEKATQIEQEIDDIKRKEKKRISIEFNVVKYTLIGKYALLKELLETSCESCLFLGCNEGVCLNCGIEKHHYLPKVSEASTK